MSIWRVTEAAAQTRGLLENKQLDQENREVTYKVIAESAARDLEEKQKAVPVTSKAEKKKAEDSTEEREKRQAEERERKKREPEKPHDSVPEEIEGHLLNIRV